MGVRNSAPLAFSFPVQLEQRAILKFIHLTKMLVAEILSELALCFGDDVYAVLSIHYWPHKFKISRVSIRDDPRPGRLPLGNIEVVTLKRLLEAPFSLLRTLREESHIPNAMVSE
jgi:hypothetical protein